MSCVAVVTLLFMLASMAAEAVSFLTSYMIINRYSPNLHDGLFQRCGALNFFQTNLNSFNQFLNSNGVDGQYRAYSGCYWWNSDIYMRDEKTLQACIVLAWISIGVAGAVFLLYLISLIETFRTKPLQIFLGLMTVFNALVLVALILVYTFLYAKEAKIAPDVYSPLLYSWSYWVLYGSAAGYFLTSILLCCNPSRID